MKTSLVNQNKQKKNNNKALYCFFSCCFNFSSLLDIINLTEQVQWVKVNTNMTGYYIVHYADDDWAALINQLKRNPYVLSDKDRANLINNIFELAG